MSSLICGDSSAAYTSFRGGGLLANYDKLCQDYKADKTDIAR